MADWFVGQRVVCVTSRWRICGWRLRWLDTWRGVPRPVEKVVYRIASVSVGLYDGIEYLTLCDLPGRFRYESDAFRPLVESRNDIGELRRLLENLDVAAHS